MTVNCDIRSLRTAGPQTGYRDPVTRIRRIEVNQVEVPQLAAILNVTEQSIRKDLAKLQKLKLVEKRGAARATYYILKEQPPTP